jgi:hypothetical protein
MNWIFLLFVLIVVFCGLHVLLSQSETFEDKKTIDSPETVIQGHTVPTNYYHFNIQEDDPSNPPVDGGASTQKKSKFMWAFNKCEPECCPATFSCDSGCVCATPEQNDFIATRGNNRHHDIW